LRRVSEVSTREIENLIGELRVLREKLEIDYDRLQNDFADYAELSQVVMQLTAIISDSVNSLPSLLDNGPIPYAPDRVVEFAAVALMAVLVSITAYAGILF